MSARLTALSFALALAAGLAVPARAQFAITVQQNGQASNASNGASIILNAPAINQTATATVKVTYLGLNSVTFGSAATITGSTSFTGSAAPTSLSTTQSTTFNLTYTANTAAQAAADFLWPYKETDAKGNAISTGAISFNLIGTAPNVTLGQITSAGTFLPIPPGGSLTLPDTLVNVASKITFAISNPGSGPATINSLSVTGDGFELQGYPLLPVTLNAGSQISLALQFLPLSPGVKSGSVQVSLASGTLPVTLSGRGVASVLSYQITQNNTTVPVIPSQVLSLGDVKVGSTTSAVIQFQNTGTTSVVVGAVGLTGAGFGITDGPFLPLTLQPQQSNTVTITYTPTQPGLSTGRLIIGSDIFPISGRGLAPLLQYSYVPGSSTLRVNPSDVISFVPASLGKSVTMDFTVTNAGTTAASLVSIGLLDTKGIFQLSRLPALPLQLEPGSSTTFTLGFSPQTGGLASTTMVINNQSFGLTGFASVPATLPSYHFTGASGTQQPFQQPSIGLSLDAPYQSPVTGVLTLTSASNNFGTDPAVQFSSGGRQVPFTIAAGSLDAIFPSGATQIRLQSGTAAGTVTITPAFSAGPTGGIDVTPPNPKALQLVVPPLAPVLLTAALGTRTLTSFSILVSGFSTTRFLDHLTFQFKPASGVSIGSGSATIDISAAARVWFQSSASQNLGGQFSIEIPFTLGNGSTSTTDLTKSLSGVSVTATNETGASNALTVVIP